MTQDIIRTNPPINAMDFGVPPSFAECAENYARWSAVAAVEDEREACAKVCEKLYLEDQSHYRDFSSGRECADAIRARGQA